MSRKRSKQFKSRASVARPQGLRFSSNPHFKFYTPSAVTRLSESFYGLVEPYSLSSPEYPSVPVSEPRLYPNKNLDSQKTSRMNNTSGTPSESTPVVINDALRVCESRRVRREVLFSKGLGRGSMKITHSPRRTEASNISCSKISKQLLLI